MNTNAVTQSDNTTALSNYASAGKTSKANYGSTIGSPELSDAAAKYYEELKKKYSDMDFVLVSEDKKESAQANADKYAKADRTVVLIDEAKIEKMAADENYRKKYEDIISGAKSQLNEMKTSLGSNESSVKTFGIQVNDNGTASFFAVIDKSLAAQRKRIEKKAEEKKLAEEKAVEKAAEKRTDQLTEKKRTETEGASDNADNNVDGSANTDKANALKSSDTVTITASSIEELMKKINDTLYEDMSNYVETDAEKKVGKSIDFSV